jgi:hypothetical protein
MRRNSDGPCLDYEARLGCRRFRLRKTSNEEDLSVDIARARYFALQVSARWPHKLDARGDHSIVVSGEVVNAQEKTYAWVMSTKKRIAG